MKFQLVSATNDRLSEIGDLYSVYDYENIMFNSFYMNYVERSITKLHLDKNRNKTP